MCSELGRIFSILGLNRLNEVSVFAVFRLFVFDFVILIYSIVIYIVTRNSRRNWSSLEPINNALSTARSSASSADRQNATTTTSIDNPNTSINNTSTNNTNSTNTTNNIVNNNNNNIYNINNSNNNPNNTKDQVKNFLEQGDTHHKSTCESIETIGQSDIARFRYNNKQKVRFIARYLLEILFITLLCSAGILNPSILSSFYFLSFLYIVTSVACNVKLGPIYKRFRFFICLYIFLHLLILFVYQIDYFRQIIPPSSLEGRLIGLKAYIESNCTNVRDPIVVDHNWNVFALPFILILLYYLAAYFVKSQLFAPKTFSDDGSCSINQRAEVVGSALPLHHFSPKHTESIPLLSAKTIKKYQTIQKRVQQKEGLEADEHGSILWRNELDALSFGSSRGNTSFLANSPYSPNIKFERYKRFALPLYIINLIKRSSYAATLIVMMTWSITYHSWLGFILLLWSCIIWMMPNSRRVCLQSSFFLVLYAIFLLISQYIFSLNLNDDELPIIYNGIHLAEIGFIKYKDASYKPLAFKIMYTLMFWITLRQYREEKVMEQWTQRHELAGPFNIGLNTSGIPRRSFQRHMSLASAVTPNISPTMIYWSNCIHNFLVKYWIWMVTIMLMVMSVGGKTVVIYKIFYMLLFLSFIFILQISFKVWRNIMYPFWSLVIIYSMSVLIAIYTYQFNHFDLYWQDYLFIGHEMQEALGLKKYGADPWILFKELSTPTFFLIITIIQLRFLHKGFLELTRQRVIEDKSQMDRPTEVRIDIESAKSESSTSKTTSPETPSTSRSRSTWVESPSQGTSKDVSTRMDSIEKSNEENEVTSRRSKLKFIHLKIKINKFSSNIIPYLSIFYQLLWRFLEIHIMKFVLLMCMITSIKEICLMNVIFVILIPIALGFTKLEKYIGHIINVWASLIILAKMIYQLDIIERYTRWYSNCTEGNVTVEYDNRAYISLLKSDSIFSYIWQDLTITLALTANAIVIIHQCFHRKASYVFDNIIFPDIDRQKAENGPLSLLKFLINFSFYKFGIEITCATMVFTIADRLDFYSVLLTFFLLIITICRRKYVRTLWPYFFTILCISLPIEYLSILGLPQGLCQKFYVDVPYTLLDWLGINQIFSSNEQIETPEMLKLVYPSKLYYNFFIILFASRQWYVFKCENDHNHPGGSNNERCYESSNAQDIEIIDFFTLTHTFFDQVKALFFTSFYWITLAIIFFTAMTPDNLFGAGYLVSCFIFLWNGSEFYLKPLRTIITSWNTLIAYNIAVLFFKNILGQFGCLYGQVLHDNYCWSIKLMGIVCPKPGTTKKEFMCEGDNYVLSLTWDAICLCFLIIQKRIFGSQYFHYLVIEIKAQQVLASRGAELIHEVQIKEVRDQENAEKEVMEKIKMKMDRIRANQQLISGKGDKIITHYQDYRYDVSPNYSTAEGTLPHTPEPTLPHTLPTVYSPTPSLPTFVSPSSAASHAEGKGYLEVFKIPYYLPKFNDTQSSGPTMPSYRSSPIEESIYPISSPPLHSPPFFSSANQSSPLYSPPHSPLHISQFFPKLDPIPPTEQITGDAFITSRPSFRVHRKPSKPLSRLSSIKRRSSLMSSLEAHHGSSIKSGDYYMFEDPDSESIDLVEKTRKSQIPDPVGDELDRIANIHGVTAFCSQLLKGTTEDEIISRKKSEEYIDVEDSSKDSAIVSVDREPVDPDLSQSTQRSTLPSKKGSSAQSTEAKSSGREYKRDDDSEYEDERSDKREAGSYVEESKSEKRGDSLLKSIEWWLKMLVMFIVSCIISITAKLNTISRDYRFVSRRLTVEKRAVKLLYQQRGTIDQTVDWRRTSEIERIQDAAGLNEADRTRLFNEKNLEPETVVEKKEQQKTSRMHSPDFYLETNVMGRFFVSLFYAMISHTEFLCYLLAIVNQLCNASLLSLPLPLMIFLWGCLSVPRPAKTFWISLITYTEVMIVIKYIFSFRVATFNDDKSYRLFGVEKTQTSNNLDLFLLLALFFHRFMLKSLGLWDIDKSNNEIIAIPSQKDDQKDDQKDQKQELKNHKNDPRDQRQKSISIHSMCDEDKKEELKEMVIRRRTITEERRESTITDYREIESEDINLEVIQTIINAGESAKKSMIRLLQPVYSFFDRLLHSTCRITRDCYAPMFFCDFVNFFIVFFGYSAFGTNPYGSDIATYFTENRIPMPFLIMLLLQFALIVIDRALYLRKNTKGRLYFHIFIVILIHAWLFFGLPALTQREFTSPSGLAPKLWYIIKSMYLLLSARQIKSGYPTRILGNCFTKKYSYVNSLLFSLYMIVPFLYDMRLLMDWIWTDTSLGLTEWAIMEDINKQLFERKAELTFEENFPEPRAQARHKLGKYIRGGGALFFIMLAIWFPLAIFALGTTVGQSHKPEGLSIEIEFSGYQPIFKMSTTMEELKTFDESQWAALEKRTPRAGTNFLSQYGPADASIAPINGNSTAVWVISPPSQMALLDQLMNNSKITVKVTWFVSRKLSKNQNIDSNIHQSHTVEIKENNTTLRNNLISMLNNSEPNERDNQTVSAVLENIFPNYIKIPERGYPTEVDSLGPAFRNVRIILRKGSFENGSFVQWWEVSDICDENYPFTYLGLTHQCKYLITVLFTDRTFPGTVLQVISGYGIIGLYTTFVFVVSRMIRGYLADICTKVIYTQMPCVDRVLQLCLDIYLVRESREFGLEEDLYAKLIFLYRSPETLIKWTKPIEPPQVKRRITNEDE